MTFFNSLSSFYKSPVGAVAAGTPVQLTICVPRSMGCTAPRLICRHDDAPTPQELAMRPLAPMGDVQPFTVSFTPDTVGLYFYYFDLYVDYQKLFRGALGTACLTQGEAEAYQLTVCHADFQTPDTVRGGVIYQIFPDRFYESQPHTEMPFADRIYRENKRGEPYFYPNEDGGWLNMDYYGGDLRGICEKLPYLADLGVTLIYLNPIFEAHANHRYNTADYLNIDPLLGTKDDFSALCREAKRHGIGIILDGVFSHTGSDSVYFNREGRYASAGAYHDEHSPYRQWYDFSQQYPCGYRSWWGFDTLPEVNEHNASYRAFICGTGGVIDHWLKLGAAGFRLDVADELPDSFIEEIRTAVKRNGADKLLIGEVWEDATNKFSYGSRRTYLLGKGLDSVMNYPFRSAILDFLRSANAQNAAEAFTRICENYPAPALHTMMNFLSTHDTVRAITALAGESCEGKDRYWQSARTLCPEEYEHGIQLMVLAFAMLYTLPGLACVYYGDEIAMQGYKDPFNRAYFQWDSRESRLRPVLRALAALRRSSPAFRSGSLSIVTANGGFLHYTRSLGAHSAEICINRSSEPQSVVLAGRITTIPPLHFAICTSLTQGPCCGSALRIFRSDTPVSDMPQNC